MNFKKTLIFFIIFALAGTYVYVIEIKKAEKTEQLEKEEKRVFNPIKKEDISEVVIINQDKDKPLHLIKKNDTWKIIKPVKADTEEDSLNIWLNYVAKLPKERTILKSPKNISDFGLDKPSFSLQVIANSSQSVTLLSGDENPTGNMFFSKLADKDPVFLIASYNKVGINKTVYDLRDKNIFHFEDSNVQKINVSSKDGAYSVEKKDDKWQLVNPKKVPVDVAKVTSLLQKIKITKIKQFIAEEVEDLTPYGLQKADTMITLLIGKDRAPHILALGNKDKEEGVYAKTASNNRVFLLEKEFLEEFPYKFNDIRDKSIIQFEKDYTNKINFIYPDKTITVVRDNEKNWELVEPKKSKADNFETNALLNDIKFAKAVDFIPKKQGEDKIYALDKPRLIVKVFDKDIKEPRVISFGSNYQPGGAVYATVGSPDEVLLISKELFDRLSITETSLRDKHLMDIEEDKIAHIDIEAEGKEYRIALRRSEKKWLLEKPDKKNLDLMKVKEIIWKLGDIKFLDIINENGKVDLETFGLEKPVIKVDLLNKEKNNLESIFIGSKIKEKDLLYAMNSKSKTIYSIEMKFKKDLLFYFEQLMNNQKAEDSKQ